MFQNLLKLGVIAFCFSLSFSSSANQIECSKLEKNKSVEIELSKFYGYPNCFSFYNLQPNTQIDIVTFSKDKVTNNIKLYDIKNGNRTYISESNSNGEGANIISLNSTDRDVAFVYKPLSNLDSNKNLQVSYNGVNDSIQVFISNENVVDTRKNVQGKM
tara:strand:- start:91693 stop:92169 length:477 start_codon:yes stop_codon:yes gene_type:complete